MFQEVNIDKIVFFKNLAENEARRLVQDLVFFFKKALFEVKGQVVCSLVSIYFDSPQQSIK